MNEIIRWLIMLIILGYDLCNKCFCMKSYFCCWLCVNWSEGKKIDEVGGGVVREGMFVC